MPSTYHDALMQIARGAAAGVECPRCGAAAGVDCHPLPLIMGERWKSGDPHAARVRAAVTPAMEDGLRLDRAAERAKMIEGPPPTDARGRALLALAKREAQHAATVREWKAGATERDAARRAEEARRAAEREHLLECAERKAERAERAAALDQWDDDDPIGKKRQRLVRWLLRKGVSLSEARMIASRKYR
jgi:hypothetical protein